MEQKNKVNDYRLSHTLTDISVKRADYGYFVLGMTEDDLKEADFIAYNSSHIRRVRSRMKVNIPVYISSGTDENQNRDMTVKWELCIRGKSHGEITACQGLITADYDPFNITYIGDIKLSIPTVDGIGILKLYLTDGEREDVVSRNFLVFHIHRKKENVYYCDYSDIIVNAQQNSGFVFGGDALMAEGSARMCASLNKRDIPFYEYQKGFELSFEAISLEKKAMLKVYVNNILLEKREIKKLPEAKRAVLTMLYCTDYKDYKIPLSGEYFQIKIPPFVAKGLPDYFSVRIECDRGLVLFGRKSGGRATSLELNV